MGIKKSQAPQARAGNIAKSVAPDPKITFSFQFFDASDGEVCPASFRDGYTQALMERLKGLSTWRLKEFVTGTRAGVRNHSIDWERTSRPKGFAHLPKDLADVKAWQFAVSSNEHGRVHGFFIDSIFYVIWLDHDHRVYAGS